MHLAIDKTNSLFWEAANLVCNWEIQKASGVEHENALGNSEISSEVTSVIETKTYAQLIYMQQQIEIKMKSGERKVVEFWESVLNYVMIYKAKRYLQQNYSSRIIEPRETQMIASEISRINSHKNDQELISEHGLRKPKYIFRVHTGFKWNKYNRNHYDNEHPPPKIVKGYSFVIYYPDFVGRTPLYSIENDRGGSESSLIRFHAGPRYEDVLFQIVNKEWDLSWKSGFRCMFVGGILRLNFFFKQFSYRR
ncbi:Cactin [Rhynchospora pubera]|uniref:Splicing factor Cactin n=1 Tax=Rhynchospora pubera TaxID=906938 RepID=A0AAV8GA68_9POAL|nr:Cactin [Rhynchospora pubera]